MRRWLRQSVPLMGWHLLAVLWFADLLLAMLLTVFRAVKTAGIAGAFQFDDVPVLRLFDTRYARFYWGLCGGIATLTVLFGVWCWWGCRLGNPFSRGWVRRLSRPQVAALATLFGFALFQAAVIAACRPASDSAETIAVHPISALDWSAVAALAFCGALLPGVIRQMCVSARPVEVSLVQPPATSCVIRNGVAYVLGCAAVFLYALRDHLKFWDPQRNGGFEYERFFRPEEIPEANLVLYSTSVLFASLAALGGCLLISLFRSAANRGTYEVQSPRGKCDEGHLLTLLSALTWSGMLMMPWQIKLWPEIEAERGWILPAATLVFTAAALVPLIHVSRLMMVWDFRQRAEDGLQQRPDAAPFLPRPSEFALWNHVLFPIYPWLRWAGFLGSRALYAVTLAGGVAMVAGMTWAATRVESLYEFEDWRGMLKSGLLPFLRVSFALLCACFAYVVLRRLMLISSAAFASRSRRREGGRARTLGLVRACVLGLVAANLALAAWPFWGWGSVNKNVFARTAEYSNRHDFELRFLHWLLDFDRDGYSALLHGGDPDDFDAGVLPLHLDPPRDDNPVPIDEFALADRDKARKFPNLMILFLEGVTPQSISAYGKRRLKGTPHIDALAQDGVLFSEARCFYPSTWDAWFSTVSGRFLRIKEFDMSRSFHDRYSRYNNLYKVLKLAGVNRWCHMDTLPFFPMLVPHAMRHSEKTAWMSDFNSNVSAEEEERGVWRGDKRNERMLKFLDDLKPGDKFFVCEHMSDTHFPWREVPGLEWTAGDAVAFNGKRYDNYNRYFQTIARMDRQVGELVDKLKQKGLYDNTMIVIVSDHGCQWWEHEHMYYVSHLYEQCLRVPMIVRVPGVNGRRVVDEPVLQVDILATVLDLAGVKPANPHRDCPLAGRSLVPLMTGTASPEERRRFVQRDIPLMTHFDKLGVLAHSRYKLIFNRTMGTYKLFDVREDPAEMTNLADSRPQLLEELSGKLRTLIRRHPAMVGGIKKSGKTFD
ncbi:MAG: sulfatase [Planctomycetaceae bacterium]